MQLTVIGTVLGVAIGVLGAVTRAWRLRPFDALFGLYVELIRNTPFIVQLFFIFFGLPALGVRLTEWQAAVLAMVINLGRIPPRSSARAFRRCPRASWKPQPRWP